MVRLNVNLDDELHYDLKVHCATNKLKITDLIRWLIQEYLAGSDVRKLSKQAKKR